MIFYLSLGIIISILFFLKKRETVVKVKKVHRKAIISDLENNTIKLIAISMKFDTVNRVLTYNCGISLEMPKNLIALIVPDEKINKLGISHKGVTLLKNTSIQNEITISFNFENSEKDIFKVGEVIGYIVFINKNNIALKEVN